MKSLLKLFSHLILFTNPIVGLGQLENTDSLELLIVKHKQIDTMNINLKLKLSKNYILSGEINKAKALLNKINIESKKINYEYGIGGYYNYNGIIDIQTSKYDSALINLKKALIYYKKYNDYKQTNGVMANIGNLYMYQDNVVEASNYFYNALLVYERLHDTLGIFNLNTSLGSLYLSKDFDKALYYYNEALKVSKIMNNDYLFQRAMANIGIVLLDKKDYDRALKCQIFVCNYTRANNIITDYAISLFNIGRIYSELNNHKRAIDFFKSSIIQYEKIDDNQGKAISLYNLSSSYVKLNKYNEAKIVLDEAYLILKENNEVEKIAECYDIYAQIYSNTSDYTKAYYYLKKAKQVFDSINNTDITKKTLQNELNYEYEKKALKNKLEQQQQLSKIQLENERKNTLKNIFLLVTIFILAIGGILGYVLYRNNKQKQALREFEKNELKQKLLVSQMNPHFIFNSVDHIQSLIGKKDGEAKMYLHRFAKLTRQILEYSRESHISLEEEKQVLENYISIQQLLYENNFTYELTISDDIETEAYLIPPMLTQPFIENAIKHGLKDKKEQGRISILFYLDNNKLFVEIKDNGTGFINDTSRASVSSSNHKSLAMKITKERLGDFANNIIMENITNETGKIFGAKITFEIPYIYEK